MEKTIIALAAIILTILAVLPVNVKAGTSNLEVEDVETPNYTLDFKSMIITLNSIIFKTNLGGPLRFNGNTSNPGATAILGYRATILLDLDSNASSGLPYRRSLSLGPLATQGISWETAATSDINTINVTGYTYYSPPGIDAVVSVYAYFDASEDTSYNASILLVYAYYPNGTLAGRRLVFYPNLTYTSPGELKTIIDRGFIGEYYYNMTGIQPSETWRAYVIGTWSPSNPTPPSDSYLDVTDYIGGNTTIANKTIIIDGDFTDWPASPAIVDTGDGIAPDLGTGNVSMIQFAGNGSFLFVRFMNNKPYPGNPSDNIWQRYYVNLYFRVNGTTYRLYYASYSDHAVLRNLDSGVSAYLYLNRGFWRSDYAGSMGVEMGLNTSSINATFTPGSSITVFPNSTIHSILDDPLNTTSPHIIAYMWSEDSLSPYSVESVSGVLYSGLSYIEMNNIIVSVNLTRDEDFIASVYPVPPISAREPSGMAASLFLYIWFENTSWINWPVNITIPLTSANAKPYYYDKASQSYQPVPSHLYEVKDNKIIIHMTSDLYNRSDPVIGIYSTPGTVGGLLDDSTSHITPLIMMLVAAAVLALYLVIKPTH